MELYLVTDDSKPPPPYERIRAELARQIEDGTHKPGKRLPTVRALADKLHVAPNTVAKAYRALETAGLIDTRGRGGTYVRGTGDDSDAAARAAAAAYAEEALRLGVDLDAALELVRRAFVVRRDGSPS